jgi:flagellar hook protein FlgE
MIESIFVAMTGLRGYEQGLRVISNNSANLNTPGFKSADLQFADLFYSTAVMGGVPASTYGQYGYGLNTNGTTVNFVQGELASTGNGLDAAIDGLGFFVLKDDTGATHYSRDGQFKFDTDGVLVSTTTGERVMGYDSNGVLGAISIAGLRTSAARATSTVTFNGNLSSTMTTYTTSSVKLVDSTGASHTVDVRFDRVAGTLGSWTVTVLEGTTTVGTGQIAFVNGKPDPAQATVSVSYTPAGQPAMPVTLDFSSNVTSYDTGNRSTLAMASQDGFAAGGIVGTTFDADGVLEISYSNGETANGSRLALANFLSPDAVAQAGGNQFEARNGLAWVLGKPGERAFGTIKAGMVETSNVDLSKEFSNLVIMQRGYQASSQVISTANEMLAELFGMKGGR